MTPRGARAVLAAAGVLLAAPAAARDLWTQGERSLALRTSLKASLLLSHAPEDPLLFPERDGAASFWRLRLEPEARLGKAVTVVLAYEQRLRVSSQSSPLSGLSALPAETPAPYRVRSLDWRLSESGGYSWRHELDRGYLALHLPNANITVGRQAVGWGRGVLFGAVDLFAPFSPLEADREWRRGVDAVRADLKLAKRVSIDAVAAFGRSTNTSVFAARLRGYAGKVDLELVGGRRARDLFAGVTSSAAVGDAAIHGELAVFRAPEALVAGGLGDGRTAVKAVAGSSYRFSLGSGLLVFLEYHYSGFGVKHAEDILPLLAEPGFQERYLRGDTQILGRHAIAMLASYEVSPELSLTVQWLQSPVDGSGVLTPSATVTFGDKVSLLATAHVPYGRSPRGGTLRSEYGAAARSGFVQIRIYE